MKRKVEELKESLYPSNLLSFMGFEKIGDGVNQEIEITNFIGIESELYKIVLYKFVMGWNYRRIATDAKIYNSKKKLLKLREKLHKDPRVSRVLSGELISLRISSVEEEWELLSFIDTNIEDLPTNSLLRIQNEFNNYFSVYSDEEIEAIKCALIGFSATDMLRKFTREQVKTAQTAIHSFMALYNKLVYGD